MNDQLHDTCDVGNETLSTSVDWVLINEDGSSIKDERNSHVDTHTRCTSILEAQTRCPTFEENNTGGNFDENNSCCDSQEKCSTSSRSAAEIQTVKPDHHCISAVLDCIECKVQMGLMEQPPVDLLRERIRKDVCFYSFLEIFRRALCVSVYRCVW